MSQNRNTSYERGASGGQPPRIGTAGLSWRIHHTAPADPLSAGAFFRRQTMSNRERIANADRMLDERLTSPKVINSIRRDLNRLSSKNMLACVRPTGANSRGCTELPANHFGHNLASGEICKNIPAKGAATIAADHAAPTPLVRTGPGPGYYRDYDPRPSVRFNQKMWLLIRRLARQTKGTRQ